MCLGQKSRADGQESRMNGLSLDFVDPTSDKEQKYADHDADVDKTSHTGISRCGLASWMKVNLNEDKKWMNCISP